MKREPKQINSISELREYALSRPAFQTKWKLVKWTGSGNESTCVLDEYSNSRFSETIYLNKETFDVLDNAWTHRPAWKGSSVMNRIGALTFAQMFKKLGDKAFAIDLQIAVNKRENDINRQRRNMRRYNLRQEITDLLADLGREDTIEVTDNELLLQAVVALSKLAGSLVDEQ